jgi:predicted ribosome quality control (RQC) complex YloA/Tae2 family protein
MSLNSSEIDQVLAELQLPGHHIQKVIQPDFKNLYLQLFRPPQAWWLRVCLENPWVRFHATERPPRAKRSHQRFEDFLWSRLRGGRIQAVEHVFADRIVRITVERDQETSFMYLRLWGTRANIVVTDRDGTILDACFRKPSQGIETGGSFVPEPPQSHRAPRPVRPIDPGNSLNQQLEAEYRAREVAQAQQQLLQRCRRGLEKQARRLGARLGEVEHGQSRGNEAAQNRHWGDLILANLHRIRPGDTQVAVEDYEDNNRLVTLPLDPERSGGENATGYYDRAKRAEESKAMLQQNAANLRRQLQSVEQTLDRLASMDLGELRELSASLDQNRGSDATAPEAPDLEFESAGFRILVGRNARENDALLRRSTRGNDWWLHTRDYPGGYVFIRAHKGKTVPLEVLLDAGNLAVFFSKARSSGKADLYYTQVKYLRRAKDGPQGLVLPTQEKNLAIELDTERLARLGVRSGIV